MNTVELREFIQELGLNDNGKVSIMVGKVSTNDYELIKVTSGGSTVIDLDRLYAIEGAFITGQAVTDVLLVSPDGDGTLGRTWETAYKTINDALDAASTDMNAMTLILIAPNNGVGYYDINVTGNPTWACNVRLQGTMRNFAEIRNTHASASCILKLTGLVVIADIGFNLHTGNSDGLILTNGASMIHRASIDGTLLTGEAIALWFDGVAQKDAKVTDIDFEGHPSYMTALKIDNFARSHFQQMRMHNCLKGVHIVGDDSDDNLFKDIDLGDCAVGIDIDAGDDQHFHSIHFADNIRNIDDEVGNSEWGEIHGESPVVISPDSFIGIPIATSVSADTWGNDTELIASGVIDNPFRIVAIHGEADATEKFRMRFSADGGSTHYDDVQIAGLVNQIKRESSVFSPSTEYIFNKGTRISASAKSESGGNNVNVWVEIQEI